MSAGLGGLDGEGDAEGVHLDDVRDGFVLNAQPDQAAREDDVEDELGAGDSLPPASPAHELEVSIVPLTSRFHVRVRVAHIHPSLFGVGTESIRVPTERGESASPWNTRESRPMQDGWRSRRGVTSAVY